MKKSMEYVTLDASVHHWLLTHLPGVSGGEELYQALLQLQNGGCSAVMLEPGEADAGQDFSLQLTAGALCVQPRARRVLRDGAEVALTPKEFDILLFLMRNRGQVFTKEQSYQAVWDGEYLMDDSNIMAFIRKLRKKIEPNPDAPVYIQTIWGIGYKFNDAL